MRFDINYYKETRHAVIDKIKSTHDWENTEGFLADGLISPEIYNKADFKIICFLGESYGFDKCGVVDIETQIEKNILGVGHPRRHTPTKISILLWLLYESMNRNEKVKWDEFPCLMKSSDINTEILQNAIAKSAWINVKKASKHIEDWGNDATRQTYTEIYEHSLRNKEILKLQLDSTSPDLMIICSDPVFDSLLEMDLLGRNIERVKYKVQKNEFGQLIIFVNHPSYFTDWGYDGIYITFEIIYEEIKKSTHNKP